MMSLRARRRIKLLNHDGEKHILAGIALPEVGETLRAFVKRAPRGTWVVIGTIAFCAQVRSRTTHNIDIAVTSDNDLEAIASSIHETFARRADNVFVYGPTGKEVQVLTPSHLRILPELVQAMLDSARVDNVGGTLVKVATPRLLIVSKLMLAMGRGWQAMMAQTDILRLCEVYGKQDISTLPLPEPALAFYAHLLAENDEVG